MSPALLERGCPVCAGARHEPFLQKGELRLVHCECGMIFVNPVERAMVDRSFYEEAGVSFYLSGPKLEGDFSPVRFRRELKLFRTYCTAGKVLDVGCSNGAFLYNLLQYDAGAYDCWGTDVSGPALEYASSKGVKVIESNFPEREFDAVTLWAVLEHVLNPRAFVEKAAELLKPGGHCFVLVPNMKSLAVRVLGGKYRYILPQHINYFAKETLLKLAPPALRCVGFKSTHFNPLVILQDWRNPAGFVPDADRAATLAQTNKLKQYPILAPARFAYGVAEQMLSALELADNIVAVFRKVR